MTEKIEYHQAIEVLKEMFPNYDMDVIQSILLANCSILIFRGLC